MGLVTCSPNLSPPKTDSSAQPEWTEEMRKVKFTEKPSVAAPRVAQASTFDEVAGQPSVTTSLRWGTSDTNTDDLLKSASSPCPAAR